MTQALVRLVAVVVSAAVAAGCVNRRVALPHETRPATCRGVVDAFNRASGTPVAWYEVTDRSDRLDMAQSCTSVGPAVYGPPLHDEQNAHLPADSLAVLSWNVHVGGGDIIELVGDLRAGRLTDGKPVHDFVVLLQEAFRGGVTVPSVRWRSFPIPRRIEEAPPVRSRQDIVQVASALGLGIFYLPSMRNGAAEGSEAEDRGNAILSTRALSDLAGIELPFERQRRVAASATVTGIDAVGNPWQLRLVTAHLNATASIRRLWVFAAAARARQAGHLARVLASNPVPTVIGSDLNSWAGGASEPAFRKLRAHFPQTPDPGEEPTFRRGKRLDYVFLRVPAAWLGQFTTIEDFFGSDHRPLLGWIEFASTTASASATSSYPRAWSFIRMATRFGVRVRPPEAPLTVSRVPFHETTRGRQPGTYNGGCDRLVIVDVHGGGVRCIAA